MSVTAIEHERRVIYRSPQTPGYTCWAGAWTMPGGDIMTCFTQATGPIDGRAPGPPEVLRKLNWPPGESEHFKGDPRYDMTGLDMCNVHLRSQDRGDTWRQVSADKFETCMNGITGECQTALRDGTIIRGVFGWYLPFNLEKPQTGYMELSTDGSKTWGEPHILLGPTKYFTMPKRVRQLRDGRVIAIGGLAHGRANSRTRYEYHTLLEPMLLVSEDGGRTWGGPQTVIPDDLKDK